MFRTGMLTVVLLALMTGDGQAGDLQWSREMDTPEIQATSLVSVPLDVHFHEHTRFRWSDVRIVNAEGVAQGFVIRKMAESKSRTVRQFWTAQQISASVDGDRELIVEFSLRENEPRPNGLRILTPLHDFERQVRVEHSNDGKTWSPAGPPTLIFDYSRYVNARNDLVPFEASDHRHFRLIINDLTDEQEGRLMELQRRLKESSEVERTQTTTIARRPFRIDQTEFFRDEQKIESGKSQLASYTVEAFQVTEDKHRQVTIVTIPAQRQPITQIKILTSSENFSRPVTVECDIETDSGQRTPQKSHGTLTRFSIGTIQKDETTIELPESRSSEFRVTIENHDSAPLVVTGVEFAGPQYEIISLTTPGTHATLQYGSADAEGQHFDTAALETALSQRVPILQGTLQAPRENTHAVPKASTWKPWNDVRFFTAVALMLAVLLGIGLYRASLKLPPS